MTDRNGDYIVVGIDVGMTRTGVAYFWNRSGRLGPGRLEHVQEWPAPNRFPSARDDKVPTRLVYTDGDLQGGGELKQWGFACHHRSLAVEWFKRYLDPKFQHYSRMKYPALAYTVEAIERFYVDYLSKLYEHLAGLLVKENGDWTLAKVQFLFSLPSTFTSTAISAKFLRYIKQAGFGSGGPHHTVEISLTEPEAAAVYAVKRSARGFKPNEVILVVDAGGGTTDMCVLEMNGTTSRPSFNEMIPVNGLNVGSTDIDSAFQSLVIEKMKLAGLDLSKEPWWDMARGDEYERLKCKFGESSSRSPYLSVAVPTLPPTFSNKDFGIVDGRMLFSREEFNALFDTPIAEIEYAIRSQLDEFEKKYPERQVNYLVLCGGLGSSAYLREQLTRRLEGKNGSVSHHRAQAMVVCVPRDPQLAVMKGLVIDRIQRMQTGDPVLRVRRCRVSYGILASVPFDPEAHEEEEHYTNPFTGQKLALNIIKWIIKKGDEIRPKQKIDLDKWRWYYEPREKVKMMEYKVVMSDAELEDLPKSLLDNDVEMLCSITSDFSSVDDSELTAAYKPRPWNKLRGELYYILEHRVKVVIGPSDLRCEMIFKGERYDDGHQMLKLEYVDDVSGSSGWNDEAVWQRAKRMRMRKQASGVGWNGSVLSL